MICDGLPRVTAAHTFPQSGYFYAAGSCRDKVQISPRLTTCTGDAVWRETWFWRGGLLRINYQEGRKSKWMFSLALLSGNSPCDIPSGTRDPVTVRVWPSIVEVGLY